MRINDNKKRGDELSAVDWNRVAKISNALINSSWNGLDATINENLISVSLPQGTFITDVRPALITDVGTDNSGTGTYRAVEAQLDTFTDPFNWAWIERLDAHNVWNTEGRNNGDANTEKKYYYDLYEINGTTGIAVGTVVLAMKIGRTANDKGNTDQWVFAIGGAGAQGGQFAVTYDSDANEFQVGANRDSEGQEDLIISGLDSLELTTVESISRGTNTDGWIYYEIDDSGVSPFIQTTLKISDSGGTPVAQEVDKYIHHLARYKHDGSTLTLLKQVSFDNIILDGRFG